jgi:hypothetical protein
MKQDVAFKTSGLEGDARAGISPIILKPLDWFSGGRNIKGSDRRT